MMMRHVLVDSCVIIDLLEKEHQPIGWEWSYNAITALEKTGVILCINPIIYAEVAFTFNNQQALDTALSRYTYLDSFSEKVSFLAKEKRIFNKDNGISRRFTPDCFIGAHACILGIPLLTRNENDFKYFTSKGLELCDPSNTFFS